MARSNRLRYSHRKETAESVIRSNALRQLERMQRRLSDSPTGCSPTAPHCRCSALHRRSATHRCRSRTMDACGICRSCRPGRGTRLSKFGQARSPDEYPGEIAGRVAMIAVAPVRSQEILTAIIVVDSRNIRFGSHEVVLNGICEGRDGVLSYPKRCRGGN